MLAISALTVPFGHAADRIGRKRIFIIGIGCFAAFSVLTVLFTHSFAITLAFRIFQGVGSSMIYSTATAVLVDSFPPEKRGSVLGFTVSATYVGITSGPVLGGVLNNAFGWRSLFVFLSIVIVAVFVVAFLNFPKDSPEVGFRLKTGFNFFENMLYSVAVVCVMFGFAAFAESDVAKISMMAGIPLFALFVRYECKVENPVIEIGVFIRNPNYSLSVLASFFAYSATFAVGYLLSVYMQTNMGFNSRTAGLVLVSQPLAMAIVAPVSGKISDKKSPYFLASIGMGVCALSLLAFLLSGKTISLLAVVANLTAVGIGFGIFSPPNTNAIMSSVDARDYNAASSILATVRAFGQTASMAVVTLVFGAKIGSATFENVAPALLGESTHMCFIVFSALCFVGIFLSARRRTRRAEC
jgi:MFS family permease